MKFYRTNIQRSGTINGWDVNDYIITASDDKTVKAIEASSMFQKGLIVLLDDKGADIALPQVTVIDKLFSASELMEIKTLIPENEIKSAIITLLNGKKAKQFEESLSVSGEDELVPPKNANELTLNEIKAMLKEKNIDFKPKSSKNELLDLLLNAPKEAGEDAPAEESVF